MDPFAAEFVSESLCGRRVRTVVGDDVGAFAVRDPGGGRTDTPGRPGDEDRLTAQDSPSSCDRLCAGDFHDRAADERCLLGGQESDERCHLVGATDPAERDLPVEVLDGHAPRREYRLNHRRVDLARAHRVDADVVRRVITRETLWVNAMPVV